MKRGQTVRWGFLVVLLSFASGQILPVDQPTTVLSSSSDSESAGQLPAVEAPAPAPETETVVASPAIEDATTLAALAATSAVEEATTQAGVASTPSIEVTASATVAVPAVVPTPANEYAVSDLEKSPELPRSFPHLEENPEGAQGTQEVASHQTTEPQQPKENPNGVTICDGEQFCSGHGRCLQKNGRTKCKCQQPYTGADCSESEADAFALSGESTPEAVPEQMDGADGDTALEEQALLTNFGSDSLYGRLLTFAIICAVAVCGVLVFTCRGSRRGSPASYKALSASEAEAEAHEEEDEEAGQWGWDDDGSDPQVQLSDISENKVSSPAAPSAPDPIELKAFPLPREPAIEAASVTPPVTSAPPTTTATPVASSSPTSVVTKGLKLNRPAPQNKKPSAPSDRASGGNYSEKKAATHPPPTAVQSAADYFSELGIMAKPTFHENNKQKASKTVGSRSRSYLAADDVQGEATWDGGDDDLDDLLK